MKNLSDINIAAMSLEEALEHPEVVSRISVYCEKQKEYSILFKAAEAARKKHVELDVQLQDAWATNRYWKDVLHQAEMKRFSTGVNLEEVKQEIKEKLSIFNSKTAQSQVLVQRENLAAQENIRMQDLLREAKNLLDRSYHDIFYSYKD
jgi:hypothetical protein